MKQKELVKSHRQELRGRDFSDQFPKGILEQRTVLIWNKLSKEALMMSLQLILYMLKSTLSWPEHRSMAVLILCQAPFSNSLFMSIIDISAFSCCYCCWFEVISDVFLGVWTVRFIAQLKHRHTHAHLYTHTQHYKMCSSYTNINFVYMDQMVIPPFVNAFFTLFLDQSDNTYFNWKRFQPVT